MGSAVATAARTLYRTTVLPDFAVTVVIGFAVCYAVVPYCLRRRRYCSSNAVIFSFRRRLLPVSFVPVVFCRRRMLPSSSIAVVVCCRRRCPALRYLLSPFSNCFVVGTAVPVHVIFLFW